MGGDPFKKVQHGESFAVDATAQNAMLAAGQAFKPPGQGGPPVLTDKTNNLVKVKNSSGGDIGRFSVLSVSGVLFSPTDNLQEFQNNFAFDGVTPTFPGSLGRFVVTQEPLKEDAIGLAVVSGLTPVQIQVDEGEEAYNYADVWTGGSTSVLHPHPISGSAYIFYKESGTGTKWAIVRISNLTLVS